MKILGVHPVLASQPCHLIEVEIEKRGGPADWGAVIQEDPQQHRDNWQAAYSETPLNDDATRWAFFFHYLDFSKPLLTPDGPQELPSPTPLPDHLKHLSYEEP